MSTMTSTSTRTAHRRHSVAAQRTPVASSSFLASHNFKSTLLARRTYSASRVRSFVFIALALVALLAMSLLLRSALFLDPPPRHLQPFEHKDVYRPASRAFRYADDSHATPDAAQPYSFSARSDDELGALVGFLAALASNSIPLTVDPNAPLDPQLVLGFDTRSGSAAVIAEVRDAVAETWARNPVVIFSEFRTTVAPASREIKQLIGALNLHPEPAVFEVDQRADASVLRPILQRLTGHGIPLVLVGGQPLSLADAHNAERLKELVTAAGAIVDGKPSKRHRKH